jgi:hypothetical protein
MKINTLYTNMPDLPLTTPAPVKNGILIAWREGNVIYPLGPHKNPDGSSRWFSFPYFQYVIRFYLRWWMTVLGWVAIASAACWLSAWCLVLLLFVPGPYIAYRFGDRFGYWGSKAFGVDNEPYKYWMCEPKEVYDGSIALMLSSIRPFGRGK